ncbi:Topoisomerase DNA binding C4 zinc finger [Saccharicrinis carchari]|uniref:Topoisomerase DNA binding C4 zinc finger n=1 Tax=Saccharicrinis carchari TaxID=1168039 RepID=A0A521F4L0_SACCC|nr:NERD domain-containing protein [Saccharicrinis carchari]SMO91084.1 Topoisomerase DNA binding C4 zinc finger [Saccharicrinis carchari]
MKYITAVRLIFLNSSLKLNELITYFLLLSTLYILFIAFKKYYLPKILGRLGEYYVARTLKRLNKKDYVVYNNIYLRNNGNTSQIDHLVLSIYGIFVIETKNYKGWIFGNDRSKYWTQILYKKKYKIYNPVIQNWTHVNFLKRISFELKNSNYFPIIVFAGNAKLKKIVSSVPVIYKRKLIRTIKRNKEVHITHEQLAKIDRTIKQSLISGKVIKKEHIKNVKRNIKRKKAKRRGDSNICPKCGGKLVIKQGRYGWFQGCSNYPICKSTKNVK